MTKTIRALRAGFVSAGVLLALFAVSGLTAPRAHAAISQLGLGSRGADVTALQQFLAGNSLIYPEGLITGYYGALTRAAVVQFQVAYDIPQVGQVGPVTQGKINAILASNLGLDVSGPVMGNFSMQVSNNNATINFNTNEGSRAQVFYDTMPIRADESSMHADLPYISGSLAPYTTDLRTTHSVNIPGLQNNTTYYYMVRSIDASGNTNVFLPNTFHTNQ